MDRDRHWDRTSARDAIVHARRRGGERRQAIRES
jgi:hypothetical protein